MTAPCTHQGPSWGTFINTALPHCRVCYYWYTKAKEEAEAAARAAGGLSPVGGFTRLLSG